MALSADRANARITPFAELIMPYDVDGGSTIYKHALVCPNALGYLVPAADTSGFEDVVGIAEKKVDNSDGSDGDEVCPVRSGIVVNLACSGADHTWLGEMAYATADDTVAITSSNNIQVGPVVKIVSATEVLVAIPAGGHGG